jgi:ACT domain-containing protein
MKVMLEAELLDEPGQLVKALKVISKYEGNINEIIHIGERTTKRDGKVFIPLRLIFTVPEEPRVKLIEQDLLLEGIGVLTTKVGDESTEIQVMLCGKKESIDVRDILLNAGLGGVGVVDFKYMLSQAGDTFSAVFRLAIPHGKESAVLRNFEAYAEKNHLLAIKPVRE